jgi:hypothetical protein
VPRLRSPSRKLLRAEKLLPPKTSESEQSAAETPAAEPRVLKSYSPVASCSHDQSNLLMFAAPLAKW